MREIRGGIFQGHFHNLLISKNNTFWALHISRITFQVVYFYSSCCQQASERLSGNKAFLTEDVRSYAWQG